MKGTFRCLAAATFVLSLATNAFTLQWTGDLENEVLVPACFKGSVSFPWRYQLGQGESIQVIRWIFQAQGKVPVVIGMSGGSAFLPSEEYTDRVQFLGNAGLVVTRVTWTDSGSYTVEVDVHNSSTASAHYEMTAHLEVADFFRVTPEPLPQYDDTTDSWHLQLKCGLFSSMEEPTGVTWITPSGSTEFSTSYKDGYLYLQLPNPVLGGKYACRLPPNSSTTACLPDDSALSSQPSYMVDETKARLTLLEAENRQLKAKLEIESRRVTFHARLSGSRLYGNNVPVIMDLVLSNEGNAYNATSGDFIVPYNGTYFLATTVQGFASTSYFANIEIRVDNTVVCWTVSKYQSYYETSTCHVTVQLIKGQRVWLRSTSSSNYFNGLYNMFSGFLIDADE